jgi:hypothetical protein
MFCRSLPRSGDVSIFACCVFGGGVFTGPLPSNAQAMHIKIFLLHILVISWAEE